MKAPLSACATLLLFALLLPGCGTLGAPTHVSPVQVPPAAPALTWRLTTSTLDLLSLPLHLLSNYAAGPGLQTTFAAHTLGDSVDGLRTLAYEGEGEWSFLYRQNGSKPGGVVVPLSVPSAYLFSQLDSGTLGARTGAPFRVLEVTWEGRIYTVWATRNVEVGRPFGPLTQWDLLAHDHQRLEVLNGDHELVAVVEALGRPFLAPAGRLTWEVSAYPGPDLDRNPPGLKRLLTGLVIWHAVTMEARFYELEVPGRWTKAAVEKYPTTYDW